MATKWPEKRRLLGTKVKRIDGPEKATGKAKYSFDINRPGMLHGMILRSPHAHAKIKSRDLSPAESMPGGKAVIAINNAKEGKELYYAGDEMPACAARPGDLGSEFNAGTEGNTAAELAKKAGAPVKIMLDREEEVTTAGNRPSVHGTVKIAGTKDGSITAFDVDCHGTQGASAGGATVNFQALPYIYLDTIPNWKRKHTVARTNAGGARAMRAPGHPQSCRLTEFAVDDLAAKLGIDPLIVRRKNLPPNDADVRTKDPHAFAGRRNDIYNEQLDIAVRLSGWKEKWHPPGQRPGAGPVKHGLGMAIHTWGGYAAQNNQCVITISR